MAIETYDTIGVNYSGFRRPDARIEHAIAMALASARTVLNVGAGTGSYEPRDRIVTAIEPSAEMIRQRNASAAPVVQGCAEYLPFEDNRFDAAMAVLTVHHWTNKKRGMAEMRRVAKDRVVVLTFDPSYRQFWLADYIPDLARLDARQMPGLADFEDWLGPVDILPVPIPHDCTDGFLGAYWRQPAAFLDPNVRAAISCFWALERADSGLKELASDIETGAWEDRYGHLLELDTLDVGYRLVVTRR